MQHKKLIGYTLALISAIAFGLNPLFVLPIKSSSIPLEVTLFYRFLMGAAMIAVFLLLKGENLSAPKKDLGKLTFMGSMYALSSEFLFWGYDAMSAGVASTVLYTYPMIVALILYLGYHEKIKQTTKISMLMALAGVAVLGWDDSGTRFNFWGVFVVFASGLVYSIYMIMVNKGKLGLSGIKITMYSLFFSAIYFGIRSLFLRQSFVLPDFHWVGFIALFSLVTTVISVLTVVYAIKLVGSTSTAILSAFEPLVAVLVSVSMFHEPMTWRLTLGMILVLLAVSIHVYGEQRKRLSLSWVKGK